MNEVLNKFIVQKKTYIIIKSGPKYVGITHDAYGFYLFSNLEEYRSVETIAKQLPKYTILSEE